MTAGAHSSLVVRVMGTWPEAVEKRIGHSVAETIRLRRCPRRIQALLHREHRETQGTTHLHSNTSHLGSRCRADAPSSKGYIHLRSSHTSQCTGVESWGVGNCLVASRQAVQVTDLSMSVAKAWGSLRERAVATDFVAMREAAVTGSAR